MWSGNGSNDVPIRVRRNRWIAALAVLIVVAVGTWLLIRTDGPAPPTEVSLDPRATYLRHSPGAARPARALSLQELGLSPGDSVRLVRMGRWAEGTGQAYGHLIGVFSATDSLAPADYRHRVVGAVDAHGPERATGWSPRGEGPTDIPHDFGFGSPTRDSVTVRVPEGARYLFLAVDDLRPGDNQVAEEPFGVRIVPLGAGSG